MTIRVGRWQVWTADGETMSPAAWLEAVDRLQAHGSSLHRSKHADTYRWTRAEGDVYVKVYRRYRRWTALKDWFRPAKAENVRRVSADLTALGFLVPRVVAMATEHGVLGPGRSWCATAALVGEPIADRLGMLAQAVESTMPARAVESTTRAPAVDPPAPARAVEATTLGPGRDRTTLRAKRGLLATLGREIAGLHIRGVVPGDLVPANVWIAIADGDLRIAFLDHDRTRIGRAPVPWHRGRRNLVQLNRVVLTGIGLTDRLRVYRAYVGARGWTRADADRRLGWIVAKTIVRRLAERGTPSTAAGSGFRALMRAERVPR
jgi:hypothetical protein